MSLDASNEQQLAEVIYPPEFHRGYDTVPSDQEPEAPLDTPKTTQRILRKRLGAAALHASIVTASVLGGAGAVAYGPELPFDLGSTHIDIAGLDVRVTPKPGQNYSSLDGVLLRQDHAVLPIIHKPVGINLHVDNPNNLNFDDTADRAAFTQLGQDPKPEIARIQKAALENALRNGAGGLGLTLGSLELMAFAARRWKRAYPDGIGDKPTDERGLLRMVKVAGIGTTAVILAGAATSGAAAFHEHDEQIIVGNPLFYGKPMAGTEITGAAEQAAPYALAMLSGNESKFAPRATASLEKLIKDHPELVGDDDSITFVNVDDIQFNDPMARMWGVLAKMTNANFMTNTGDMFDFAKPSESYILNTPNFYSGDIPIYFSPGRHDPNSVLKYTKMAGWHTDPNELYDVDGLTFMLVPTAVVSDVGNFGAGDSLRDPGISEDQAMNETLKRIKENEPDFVFTHEEDTGSQIAAIGDVQMATIDGRSYAELGSRSVQNLKGGASVEYTSGSGSGLVNTTESNPGDITHPATMTIFKYSKSSHELHYSVVTFDPDGSVKATPLINIAVPYTSYQETGRTELKNPDVDKVPYSATTVADTLPKAQQPNN